MQILRYDSLTPTPWRNGGGITREVRREPAQGRWRWRVSLAEVAQSGPFSDFTGYRRTMALLEGNGVLLRFTGGTERTLRSVGELTEFCGGVPTEGVLLAGPCVDLNLMVDETLPPPTVERITGARWLAPARAHELRLLVPLETSVALIVAGREERLERWDCAFVEPGDGAVIVLPERSAVLCAVLPN